MSYATAFGKDFWDLTPKEIQEKNRKRALHGFTAADRAQVMNNVVCEYCMARASEQADHKLGLLFAQYAPALGIDMTHHSNGQALCMSCHGHKENRELKFHSMLSEARSAGASWEVQVTMVKRFLQRENLAKASARKKFQSDRNPNRVQKHHRLMNQFRKMLIANHLHERNWRKAASFELKQRLESILTQVRENRKV